MSSHHPDLGTCLWSPNHNWFMVMVDRVNCMPILKGRHQLQITNLTIRAHREEVSVQMSHTGKDTCLCRVGRREKHIL